ncbi:hypothetical protein DFH11DRAFT_1877430 [Phellopilus nigrolimitatus]|nr:hypothetical protein DFH11DRAFT_1877430 [Phellopilus nigrolimitatus]
MSRTPFDLAGMVVSPPLWFASKTDTPAREFAQSLEENSSSHCFYNAGEFALKKPSARDVFIRDLSGSIVAGLIQTGWYRNSDLYRWLRIVLVTDEPFLLRHASSDRNQALVNDDASLIEPSDYHIVNKTGNVISARPISEILRKRINFSGYSTPQNEVDEIFRKRIMERDGRCCCSNEKLPPEIFESDPTTSIIDIFPSAYVEEFLDSSLPSSLGLNGPRKERVKFMRSLQNGMTMDIVAILLFEDYDLAVDVDDDYRIVQLCPNPHINLGPEGKLYVDFSKPEEERPSEILLREHFRHALIKHVLGTGKDPYLKPPCDENGEERADDDKCWFEITTMLRDRCDSSIDLSEKIWLTPEGKAAVEQYLQTALLACMPECLEDGPESSELQPLSEEQFSRFSKRRREELAEIKTPSSEEDHSWPEEFVHTPPMDFSYLSDSRWDNSEWPATEWPATEWPAKWDLEPCEADSE